MPVREDSIENAMYQAILGLDSEDGITASGREEVYGCTFGRDTAITVLKLLKSCAENPDERLLDISKRSLITLLSLQGTKKNIESGEEPGKFIHEFRREKYEHLIKGEKPWFIYEDKMLRNYDSIDSTPLTLIALFRFWEISGDENFLRQSIPAVRAGLEWIIRWGDFDRDGLLEYMPDPRRNSGGLTVQSWTDSFESFMRPDGSFPPYPLAPVEVQGFSWVALRLWGKFFENEDSQFSAKLTDFAKKIKNSFQEKFLLKDHGLTYGAQGLDGDKKQIRTITANPLLALWAGIETNSGYECILDWNIIQDFVDRGFREDLFDSDAGIRTMSSLSPTYNAKEDSYHNGSFWPMLNGLIYEGLLNFGFYAEAGYLKEAALKPIYHFGHPIELYQKDQSGYLEYRSSSGQTGCKIQAWSAASILQMIRSSDR